MVDNTTLLAIAGALVATTFGLLCAILGWLGNRVYQKLDEMGKTLHRIAGDLHEKINGLDRRVTVVETRCGVNHTAESHPTRRADD
jgi:uncharacterized protein YoxC